MALTLGTMILYTSSIPMLSAWYISYRGYKKYRYMFLGWMQLIWGLMFVGLVLLATGYLLLDNTIYRIGIIFASLAPIPFSILMDKISKKRIEPVKISISSAIVAGVMITSFEPNSVTINVSLIGELGPAMSGNFLLFGSLSFLMMAVLWPFYLWRVQSIAPKPIKKIANLAFISTSLPIICAAFIFSTGLIWYFPGLDFFMLALSAALFSYFYSKEPRLAFILKFRIYGIYVINAESSVNLYSFHWKEIEVNDFLFTGAIRGLSMLISETLGGEEVKEITLENSKMMFYKIENLIYLLHSTEFTSLLEKSLHNFAETTMEQFANRLNNRYEISPDIIDEITKLHFPLAVVDSEVKTN